MYSPPVLGGVVADRGGYYMFFLIFFFTPSGLCLTPSKLLLLGITQASLALHSLIRNFRPPKTGGQYRSINFLCVFSNYKGIIVSILKVRFTILIVIDFLLQT